MDHFMTCQKLIQSSQPRTSTNKESTNYFVWNLWMFCVDLHKVVKSSTLQTSTYDDLLFVHSSLF